METLREKVLRWQKESSYGENPYIDPLVRPVCKLLNENECFTIGSCSCHIRHMAKKVEKESWIKNYTKMGNLAFYCGKEKMRLIWNFIEEFKKTSHIRIEFCISTERKDDLSNLILLDFYMPHNCTDDMLFEFHRSLYNGLKKAFESSEEYTKPAGETFDRHQYVHYLLNNKIAFSEVTKELRDELIEKFTYNLEELEWEE